MTKNLPLVLWFNEIKLNDTPLVGGKNASLGEMYSSLNSLGINIPNGFAVTSVSYNYFINHNNLKTKIAKILKELDTRKIENLKHCGKQIRDLILNGNFPEDLEKQIENVYGQLKTRNESEATVAVRSSATAEDLPGASFAGQQETYLNVKGKKDLIESIKKCFASLFTDRAISYRQDKGFGHFKVALSVGVQRMARSDLASSGVAFTLDPDTGFDKVIVINACYGLGELIVQGKVIPDEWIVFKEGLRKGYSSIISKKLGDKAKKIIYSKTGGTRLVDVPQNERFRPSLSEREVIFLSNWCYKIEDYFSIKYRKRQPMDIEWAKDGETGELFIIQARPETVQSLKEKNVWEEYRLTGKGKKILSGIAVGTKIASGKARVVKSITEINKFKKGEVLVTATTDPDWEPIMKIASAIVTDKGGRTSHAAIVAREMGITCVVGTEKASYKLRSGQEITVDCSLGSEGAIYQGIIPFKVEKHNLKKLPKTKTKIMVNIGSPEEAFENHFLPALGVGLAREEFIIASQIKIHPKALINYKKIGKSLKKQIEKETMGYQDKTEYFVEKLSFGISKIAAAFWPYQVIVRFSDFKSNEYKSLLGGELYEPVEQNPMLGWRGASRYYDKKFSDAFHLEIKAFKRVRDKIGLLNVVAMIPFVRTPDELIKVLKIMEGGGLKRDVSHNRECYKEVEQCPHFRVYMMCEVPSNAILVDDFLDLVDGYSIGSNDLTQLTLGLDRDSNTISQVGNENNEAVRILIKNVIEKCNQRKKYIGLCGQGPSDSIEFAEFLVKCGIKSISLNPDAVVRTLLHISKIEKN